MNTDRTKFLRYFVYKMSFSDYGKRKIGSVCDFSNKSYPTKRQYELHVENDFGKKGDGLKQAIKVKHVIGELLKTILRRGVPTVLLAIDDSAIEKWWKKYMFNPNDRSTLLFHEQ